MPNTDRDIVDRAIDAVRERVDRIREDVGNALFIVIAVYIELIWFQRLRKILC